MNVLPSFVRRAAAEAWDAFSAVLDWDRASVAVRGSATGPCGAQRPSMLSF